MQISSKARKGGPHGVLPYKGDANGRRKIKIKPPKGDQCG